MYLGRKGRGFLGGVIALAAGVALGAPTFEVTILPFPEAGDLNNAGQVAGRGAGALYIWEDGGEISKIASPKTHNCTPAPFLSDVSELL